MTVGQDPRSDVLHLSLKFDEIKHLCFHTKEDVGYKEKDNVGLKFGGRSGIQKERKYSGVRPDMYRIAM